MKLKVLVLAFLTLFVLTLKAEKYQLAVCAIFQDDALYLPEWIEFHQKQGVEKFYLYSNRSSDNYKEILKPYIKSGLVKLIEWNYTQTSLQEWNKIQCGAYRDCIKHLRGKVEWCAFIDTDEFLFSPRGVNLKEVLKGYKEYAAVGVNWMMYGTSGVWSIPLGKRMTDCLTMRAEFRYPPHIHVKSIVQPNYVSDCNNPHFFYYKPGYFAVTENKERFEGAFSPSISVSHLRINHYWSRSKDFFENVKCARQAKWSSTCEKARATEAELNDVYDPMSNYISL